ncbi:tetratricopeptide repeat protein [Nodularia sp. UHCC 0506]|uniref:tetratricopeptide repeat protein n=1 Tax=Nodularia sp. UHCC 0506 TaxID=3110243 RepID=UPI002B1ECD36|nr:tetratricopeptide repeat protein [Nodularia sp. UHCC 0506]MEA5513241.1 tetratricopeptide repeat protein [Nodularia sp. UHCC 0506]
MLSDKELENILKEITVKVIVDDREAGSGTIIKNQNGFYTVLTNYHVVENAKSVQVVTPDNQVYDAESVKLDRQDNQDDDLYDLAKLSFSSKNIYLVAGLAEEDIKPGERVLAGGYVKGNFKTTKGEVKLFLNEALIKGHQIGYDNDIKQGMSGGAIINQAGNLVGINSKIARPVLQNDFRYANNQQPDEKTLNEWDNYSWGIAINLVDEAAPDLALFPERVIVKNGGVPAEVLAIAKQSSVQIKKADGGIGSGVIIAQDNDVYYVLTAFHVVEDKQKYQVVAPDKQVYEVDNQTIRTRQGLDMAVLQFRSSQKYQVATLGDYELKDEVVFLYGWKNHEKNHPSLFSVGFMGNADVRDFWAKPRGYELAYTNEGHSGMSGGGIWDTEGRLVGIHNFAETDVLGYSLGLSIESFLFYQKDGLWQLPQAKLTVAKDEPKSFDINSFILALVPNSSAPDPLNGSGKDWLNYGIQLWRIDQTDNAITAMENAIGKDPNSWQAFYNVAWIWLGQEKYDFALAAINAAIREQPSFYRSYLSKGWIFQILKQYEDALSALNQGITEAKKDNIDDFLLYQVRGEIFGELKKHDQAIADYTQAITINPQFAEPYYNRGVVYDDQGKTELAIADYTQAITINPQFAEPYYNRGVAYDDQRKTELAIADFTQAITVNPQFANAYYNRGNAYDDQGKTELAIADYTQAITVNPQYANAYNNRGNAYSEQGKIELAIADYTQAITINPQLTEAYNNRGLAYHKQGKTELAIADFTQALQINPLLADTINPNFALTYTYRGRNYLQQNKLAEAIHNFNRAITINPQVAAPYSLRGVAYVLQGKKQQAIKDLQTAKQLYQQQGDTQGYQNVQELLKELN